MAIFGVGLVRSVLLPDNAKRRSINTEADILGLAIDGDVGDGYLAEAKVPAIGFSRQCFLIFIIDYRNWPAFRARPRQGIGEKAIKLLRGRLGAPCPRCK